MSIGMILLVVAALLILFGAAQRVLDRMALTDRQALLLVAAIFAGGWLPDLNLGLVTLNIGGCIVPVGVCVYLFLHAGTAMERIRAAVCSAITGAAIYGVSLVFPADPIAMPFDPMLLYGLIGGAVAWLLGRSRRTAFISGVLGVVLCDIAVGAINWARGIRQTVHLGGAGALDAVVLAGIGAVLLCELAGEIAERITSGRAREGAIEGGSRA